VTYWVIALTFSCGVNCAPIASTSYRSKKSCSSSGFPSNSLGASLDPTTGIAARPVCTTIGMGCAAIVAELETGLITGTCVVLATEVDIETGVTDGLIINGGGGRKCFATIGVGVVGDGKINDDCWGSGDKDENIRLSAGKMKDDVA
jgi:hypothetical protein